MNRFRVDYYVAKIEYLKLHRVIKEGSFIKKNSLK